MYPRLRYVPLLFPILIVIGCGQDIDFPALERSDADAPGYYVRDRDGAFEIWSATMNDTAFTGLQAEAGS
ncbi:MAG: hypothetical protein GY771_05995, partial [bacterium]|nr:hypothetical protein [bacterium]